MVSETLSQVSVVPGIYRHYKGQLYEVIDVAQHTETGDRFVVYRAMYGDGQLWVRPLAMFAGSVEVAGTTRSRFELVRAFGGR